MAEVLVLINDRLAAVENSLVVPEYHQIRAGANIPDLRISWSEKKPNGMPGKSRWASTIPHYKGKKQPQIPKQIKKGSYHGYLELSDNSSLKINAYSEKEVERILNIFLKLVDPTFIKDQVIVFGKRKNSLKEVTLYPVTASYYPQGYSNNKEPEWISYYWDFPKR